MAHHDEHLDDQHADCAPETPIGSPGCCATAFDSHLHLGQGQHSDAEPRIASPPEAWAHQAAQQARRKEASELLQAATGVSVPFATDHCLRSKLTDGTLLCQLANAVLGADIDYYCAADVAEMGPHGLLRQRNHNVACFQAALEQHLPGLPAACRFTLADLEAGSSDDERPQVTNCLLYIKAASRQAFRQLPPTHSSCSSTSQHHHQQQHQHHRESSPQHVQQRLSFGSPAAAAAAQDAALHHHHHHQMQQMGLVSSPLRDGQRSLSHGGQHPANGSGGGGSPAPACTSLVPVRSSAASAPGHQQHGQQGQALAVRERYGAHIAASQGVQAAAGMTRLMQQCTVMLKERMFPAEPGAGGCGSGGGRHCSPAGPDSAIKALAPVLEGVLGQLTEEYEKRLLAKDNAVSNLCDVRARLERQVEGLQNELQRLQQEAEDSSAATVEAAAQAAALVSAQAVAASVEDSSELQQQLAEARELLRQCTQELAAAQAELAASKQAQEDARLEFHAQVSLLRGQLDALQGVEAKYKQVLQENRALYNTVQDLRGNIRVFCRIRPPGATGDLSPCCVDVGDDGDLALYDLANGTRKVFKVDRVFEATADQAAVYEDTQPLIRSVLDGFNVCIFAYGQTGSGKTHTMSGTHTDAADGRGINFRALDDLFGIRDSRQDEVSYTFLVQMLEIYNESLRDLLLDPARAAADGGVTRPNKLDILATQASGCNVPGATQVEVESAADVARLMAQGAAQRATSGTKMNDRSSRSHQILTVIVEGVHHVTGERSHACLHLIDLAGSERVGRSEASGDRLVEAQHINRSLSALGDVMAALAAKDRHVPYRNSKLTQLLQDSLQGQAKVMMFMHVSPEASMFGESISTLKFASRVSEVTLGQAKKNVVSGKVFEAHEEVLKQQRTMESKDQQLAQLVADLQAEQSLRAALQQQLNQLTQQLEAQRREAAAAPARQQTQLELPLGDMVAAAQASVGSSPRHAAEACGGGTAVAPSGREPLCQPLAAGAAATPGAPGVAEPAPGGSAGGGGSRIPRAQDRTPPRDQDDACLPSAARRAETEASPLGQHCASGASSSVCNFKPAPAQADKHTPAAATPRTSRAGSAAGGSCSSSSGGGHQPVRESASSLKHLERLASARQSGSFRAAGCASAGPAGGGMSVSAFVEAVAGAGPGGLRASKLGGGGGGSSSGGGRQSLAAAGAGPLASSRSRLDSSGPLTSRVGVVAARGRLAAEASSGCVSARQSSVFRTSSNGSSAAGSGAVTSRASVSGAGGTSGAATSRGGSRWK